MKNKFIIFLLFLSIYLHAEKVSLSNEYIEISVDKQTGRFTIATLEGDPLSPLDNNKNLLYSKMPPTSLTAINIDGETIIYGSPKGEWLKKPYLSQNKIISAWQYKNLSILQEIKIIKNPSTGYEDNMLITTSILNKGGKVKVGLAYVFDILLDNKEVSFFNVAKKGIFSNELQLSGDDIPNQWTTSDSIDNSTIKVQGIINGYGAIKPDRLIFATWDRLSELWRLSINNSYDFRRRGTTQYDGAIGVFYDPKELYKNETLEGATIYGIMGGNTVTEEDYILTLNIPKEPRELPIPLTAMLINKSQSEIDELTLEIDVPKGFFITEGEQQLKTQKIPKDGMFQTKWLLSTEAAGGTFYVKVKANVFQQNQAKVLESEESFFANFTKEKKTVKPKETLISTDNTQPENKIEYIQQPVVKDKRVSRKSKIEEVENLIKEIDNFYENWMEIYNSVFTKEFSIEQINNALIEIDKDIEYFEKSLSNISKGN